MFDIARSRTCCLFVCCVDIVFATCVLCVLCVFVIVLFVCYVYGFEVLSLCSWSRLITYGAGGGVAIAVAIAAVAVIC